MGLLGYLKPASKAEKAQGQIALDEKSSSANEPPIDLPPLSPSGQRTPYTGATTPYGSSRPASIYPVGDFRNQAMEEILEVKCDVMINWLHQQQMERLWTAGTVDEGVVLKKTRGAFTCVPNSLRNEPIGLFSAIQTLNVRVAMTVNTRVIKLFLHNNSLPYVKIEEGLRLQVLPDMSYLARAAKHHFAAFIADQGLLVVWDDEPRKLLERAERIEKQLMAMIWQGESAYPQEKEQKTTEIVTEVAIGEDGLEANLPEKPRPIIFIQPILTACTLALVTTVIGVGFAKIAQEIYIDNNYIRLAFLLVVPPQIWLALFFFQAICGNVAQIIGPIGQMNQNSKYYSGIAPKRLNRDLIGELPHVTIQMPVYKEGLISVIEPTVRSLKAAISTYELQGGSANIFVNDDGMQLISEEDARARQDFYDEHNIGWVSRPKHNPKPENGETPFLRRGKFKKASNMNYALWVSARVEDKLLVFPRHDNWTADEEAAAYRAALAEVVAEDEGRTWADGNVRIGDYILIIDSDTRVPKDCFLDAVSEMEQNPQVAIIQFSSGVMNVTNTFFENGITFFTNLVYTAISFATANGDVAPFVGHNAILRWSAMQEIAYDDEEDKREKFWSEATVSEDFDMALRLQTAGYLVRLAAYTGEGFKEGVSLTVYDELSRWEKYAYGCSELIFHPLRYWFTKGPFTPLFRRFISSNMPLHSKITIMAYVGTYYAIGSAWALTLLNYFVVGWFNGYLDNYYIHSFSIYFSIIIVFTALGNLALAILRYRISERSLLSAIWECFKWIPMLNLYLGGISLHVSQAILSHLFSIDMSWGATSKEVENTTFFKEIPKVLKGFKFTFIFCILCTAMMIVLAEFAPPLWRITGIVPIYPLCSIVVSHFLVPLALNPSLMLFTF